MADHKSRSKSKEGAKQQHKKQSKSASPLHKDNSRGAGADSGKCKKIGNYFLTKTLGKGTFGKVKTGIHCLTQKKVAVKILDKDKIKEAADIERITREIKILKKMRHVNVVQLFDTISTKRHFYLITEFIKGGDLYDYLSSQEDLHEIDICQLYQQIISAVEYIHKLGIVHRDIKPENILVDFETKTLKLVDFGLSNTYGRGELLKTPCGSPCYAAPEMIAGHEYNGLLSDIWSSGVVLYCMLCGELPFDDTNIKNLYHKITNGIYTIPSNLSREAQDLLRNILNIDVKKRFNIQQIKNHPWYKLDPNYTEDIGLVPDLDSIHVDEDVVDAMIQNFLESSAQPPSKTEIFENISRNKHNEITTVYYLTLNENNKSRNASKDARTVSQIEKLRSQNLMKEQPSVKPTEQDNTTETKPFSSITQQKISNIIQSGGSNLGTNGTNDRRQKSNPTNAPSSNSRNVECNDPQYKTLNHNHIKNIEISLNFSSKQQKYNSKASKLPDSNTNTLTAKGGNVVDIPSINSQLSSINQNNYNPNISNVNIISPGSSNTNAESSITTSQAFSSHHQGKADKKLKVFQTINVNQLLKNLHNTSLAHKLNKENKKSKKKEEETENFTEKDRGDKWSYTSASESKEDTPHRTKNNLNVVVINNIVTDYTGQAIFEAQAAATEAQKKEFKRKNKESVGAKVNNNTNSNFNKVTLNKSSSFAKPIDIVGLCHLNNDKDKVLKTATSGNDTLKGLGNITSVLKDIRKVATSKNNKSQEKPDMKPKNLMSFSPKVKPEDSQDIAQKSKSIIQNFLKKNNSLSGKHGIYQNEISTVLSKHQVASRNAYNNSSLSQPKTGNNAQNTVNTLSSLRKNTITPVLNNKLKVFSSSKLKAKRDENSFQVNTTIINSSNIRESSLEGDKDRAAQGQKTNFSNFLFMSPATTSQAATGKQTGNTTNTSNYNYINTSLGNHLRYNMTGINDKHSRQSGTNTLVNNSNNATNKNLKKSHFTSFSKKKPVSIVVKKVDESSFDDKFNSYMYNQGNNTVLHNQVNLNMTINNYQNNNFSASNDRRIEKTLAGSVLVKEPNQNLNLVNDIKQSLVSYSQHKDGPEKIRVSLNSKAFIKPSEDSKQVRKNSNSNSKSKSKARQKQISYDLYSKNKLAEQPSLINTFKKPSELNLNDDNKISISTAKKTSTTVARPNINSSTTNSIAKGKEQPILGKVSINQPLFLKTNITSTSSKRNRDASDYN